MKGEASIPLGLSGPTLSSLPQTAGQLVLDSLGDWWRNGTESPGSFLLSHCPPFPMHCSVRFPLGPPLGRVSHSLLVDEEVEGMTKSLVESDRLKFFSSLPLPRDLGHQGSLVDPTAPFQGRGET